MSTDWNLVRENWKSGLTVGLVSIPLSVSLAVASQTSPIVGIITAVWAGLAASLIGGSKFNIVGPAGALSGILAVFALEFGPQYLPMLAIFAGLFIILAWVLKLERYLVLVPNSVVHGFTLSVAWTIAFGQMSSVVVSTQAVMLCLISLIAILAMQYKKSPVPPALVISGLGIILGFLIKSNIVSLPVMTLADRFPTLTVTFFQAPKLYVDWNIFKVALTVAIVAILETMLSARVADGMTKTKHNQAKEMLGLGVANLLSGLMGGLPATAVLARTVLNIKSGATHQVSATINVLTVVVVTFAFFSYFRFIPMPVIAAVLISVALKMVDWKHMWHLFKHSKINLALMFLVAGLSIYEDPVIGIAVGTGISLFLLVDKISQGHFQVSLSNKKKNDTLVYSIKGQLVHVNTHKHLARFENEFSQYDNVILRLKELCLIDFDGSQCLQDIIGLLQARNQKVILVGLTSQLEESLHAVPALTQIRQQGLIFSKTSHALKHLGYKI